MGGKSCFLTLIVPLAVPLSLTTGTVTATNRTIPFMESSSRDSESAGAGSEWSLLRPSTIGDTTNTIADSIFLSWFDSSVTPFKNPFDFPAYCHVVDKGSRICDPDEVLSARHRRELDYDVNWAMAGPNDKADRSINPPTFPPTDENQSHDDEHDLPPPSEGAQKAEGQHYFHPNCSDPGVEIAIAVGESRQTRDSTDTVRGTCTYTRTTLAVRVSMESGDDDDSYDEFSQLAVGINSLVS